MQPKKAYLSKQGGRPSNSLVWLIVSFDLCRRENLLCYSKLGIGKIQKKFYFEIKCGGVLRKKILLHFCLLDIYKKRGRSDTTLGGCTGVGISGTKYRPYI